MATLATLVLATSIFGFSLTPPQLASLGAVASARADAGSLGYAALAAPISATPAIADGAAANQVYVEQVRRRAKLAKIHRALGIASWSAMTLAVASGTVQYRNLYGGGSLAQTPCVTGDAWPRQEGCYGHPTAHLALGTTTAALYATTLALAYAMPDPDDARAGSSQFARRLRTHRALHWVHLAGMISQMVLGPLIANPQWLGLSRGQDFRTLRALAAVHLSVGFVTWGAMGSAGSLMLF